MSIHAQLVLAVWFAGLMGIGALAFTGWVMWHAFWDTYDYYLQQRTRKRMRQFDARVGRDCYRDTPGVHR